MNPNDIAVTIRDQIRFGQVRGCRNGTHAMMCWGFQRPMSSTDQQDGCHGLVFKVNGLVHKGFVWVKLMGNDTYTILTLKLAKGDWQVAREDVYCDELAQVLDILIEGSK